MPLIKTAFVISLYLTLVFAFFACDDTIKAKPFYENDFEKQTLGDEWVKEGGHWEIKDGKLLSKGAKNKDLILNKPLPENAIIELDMISHSPTVDIKFRAWGDKRKDMHDGAYHFILGGWANKISTIAPLGEHDKRRVERRDPLEPERWYHVKVVRHKGKITLSLDGVKFLEYEDKAPLDKAHFKYFSFANWMTHCEFDNLKIMAIE